MKFIEIVLDNVFAYDGDAVFDLSQTTPERNIVLIWGRNGFGKTSFLRAMQLLFCGPTEDFRAKMIFPSNRMGLQQFYFGDGGRWSGLFNRSARRRSESNKITLDASVSATWEDEEGRRHTAKRWWSAFGGEVSSGVHIDLPGGDRYAEQAAEDMLGQVLPADFVNYFFFDSEEVKSLAETAGTHQEQLDRLLQIKFVQELANELEYLAKERRKRTMDSGDRIRLTIARNELNRSIDNVASSREDLADAEDLVLSETLELKRLYTARGNLSSGASEVQREALVKQQKELNGRLESLVAKIVDEIPIDVPVLANLRMLGLVADHVDARLTVSTSGEARFARRVSVQLPEWIQSASPLLDERLVDAIAGALRTRMTETLSEIAPSGLFAGADLLRMEKLRRQLEYWSTIGVERRERQAQLLLQAHQVRQQLMEVDDALVHINVGAQGNVEEYRRVVDRIAVLEQSIEGQQQRKGALLARIADEEKKQAKLQSDISKLEADQDRASVDLKDHRFMLDVAQALNQISENLRAETRSDLEELVNIKFKSIISHNLIDRIHLDGAYTFTYTDKAGKVVGRSSISSGMKQLVATSFLWALKDLSRRKLPVIIDTPLGRIDRQNQDHMLNNYYPAIAHQVIVLPTNSELDPQKLKILRPRIAAEFVIENASGDAASVRTGSLWETGT
jgi:DNA sulfur modification protein DndD